MLFKIAKKFIFLLCFFQLFSACAPIYKTMYNYEPPEHYEGMMCVNICLLQKGQCEMSCNNAEQACINNAGWQHMVNYNNIIDKDLLGQMESRRNSAQVTCTNNKIYCNDLCTNNYNICYQNCGGRVIANQYCTAFCQ